MRINMTTEMAYRAMIIFLEGYYRATNADDIGALLGSLSIQPDGLPADSALWVEWKGAVERAIAEMT